MAQDLTPDQAIDALRKLPEDKQRLVLGKLTPDARKDILKKLTASPDFTANPKGEGLYRMLPATQQGYTDTSEEVKVPFSKVSDALNAGLQLHFDEKPRYDKDLAHQGEGPTLLERAKARIDKTLQPTTGIVGSIPVVPGLDVNAVKAAARTVMGVPEYLGQVFTAAKDVATGKANPQDQLNDLIDPTKLPESLYKQYQADREAYPNDPKIAADNLLGSLAGMGVAAAVTHGTTKAIENIPKPNVPESVRGAIRDTLGVTENTEKVVKKFGKESDEARAQNKGATEKTLKARGAVDKSNKTAVERHADAVKEHNDEVARIAKEHREKVAQQTEEHAEALKKHQDDTKAVQAKNVQALQEHLETAGKIAKENENAEDAIKARRAGEQQVAEDTAEFRKRIQDAEKKATDDNNADWDAVRKKTAGFSTDISALQKVAETAADQADPATSALFKRIIKGEEPTLPTLTRTSSAVKYVDSAGNAVDRQSISPVSFDHKVASGEFKTAPVTETVTPDDPGYGDLYERQFGEPPPVGGGPAQFNRLQRWYSYISNKMYGGGRVEGGLYNAYKMVRSAINDAMQDIAQQANATSDLAKARKSHTELMEAFSDSPTEPRTVAKAYEKAKAPEAVKETTESEWGKKLERYDPEITKLGESITKAKEGLKKLPTEDEARRMTKPLPEPPVSTPLPIAPVAPAPLAGPEYTAPPVAPEPKPYAEPKPNQPLPETPNIHAENLKLINEGLRKYGKVGGWVLRLIAGGLAEHLAHGSISVFSGNLLIGQAAVTLLTKALRSESMLDWLSKPSAEDIKTISTLPPQDAMRMREALNALAQEEREKNPSKANVKIAPAMAAFLAGGSASQQSKPKSSPLDEVKAKAQELQNSFHKSGFAPAPAESLAPPKPQSSNKITHRFNSSTGEIEAA